MKGHMQDGKFHPHTQFKKGVRKSRDQKAKTKGVIRKDRAFDNSGKVVGHATWTGHGRGFGHSYGWQVPDGAFHVIDKRNIPESLRPNGGVEISAGKFKGKILDLKDGKIHFQHLKGVCNFCGKRGFDVRKGCPNNCGKILRDDKGKITAIVGSNFVRKARAIDEETNLDMKVKKLEESLKEGLDEHFKNNPKFKNAVWDVDVMYTGSHGTVDSEYFTITAFRKGVGSVEYQEAFSNDDWFDTSDSKLVKKIENNQEFAQMEYDKWLISILDIYEDAMFEGLVATIESEFA